MPKKQLTESYVAQIKECRVPIQIIWEHRNGFRSSIGKKAAILRLPLGITREEQKERIARFHDWIEYHLSKKEALRQRFIFKEYRSGDQLTVGKRQYQLAVTYSSNKNISGKLKAGQIALDIPFGLPDEVIKKGTEHVLSRLVGMDFKPEITKRMLDLNRQHFQVTVTDVRLKYNHSNWGSCSASGIINLSTRLLFAPDEVIDYVIIHELAHRKQMNHSPRFWALVARAMPDYKEKEKWLRENSHLCQF